ncbi:TolC family protein [Caulobacter soli]|uniref:TolC family protein n=1 Tax=Caulobacter soli TaxID=2708539 RepID=UPI0013EC3CB9|nr:TolC family protein [Caulobacter soli]
MPVVRLAVVPFALVGAAILLAGCTTYVAAPIHLETYPSALAARRLDEKAAGATWSGGDLLAAALARNAAVAEAAAKYRTAVAAAKASRAAPGMTLTLTAEYARAEPKQWLYGLGSDIPLDIGARRGERLNAADLAAVQALYDYGEVVWTVRTALTRARADRLSADAELVLAGRLEAVRQARADRLDRRVAAGEDDRGPALIARTDLAVARRRVADARARRVQADATLAQALGVPVAAVADLSLASVASPPRDPDPTQARRDAALTRRDVLRAVVDYDLAESALRLEIAKQYPEIHIGPGYTYDHGVSKLPFNLGLVLPPMDMNRSAIAQAEAKRAEAGRSLEAVQAAALGAVDQAWATLGAARTTEASTRERDLPIAQHLADGAARSARAGEADRIDDLAAQAVLIEAELAVLDADRAATTAGIDLEDALRAPFDPAETTLLQNASRALGGR